MSVSVPIPAVLVPNDLTHVIEEQKDPNDRAEFLHPPAWPPRHRRFNTVPLQPVDYELVFCGVVAPDKYVSVLFHQRQYIGYGAVTYGAVTYVCRVSNIWVDLMVPFSRQMILYATYDSSSGMLSGGTSVGTSIVASRVDAWYLYHRLLAVVELVVAREGGGTIKRWDLGIVVFV